MPFSQKKIKKSQDFPKKTLVRGKIKICAGLVKKKESGAFLLC